MAPLPAGTVTFLFTDLEGSTRLWQDHPQAMGDALARHDAILRDAVVEYGGSLVKTTGDGIHAAFPTAHGALDAAVAMQERLSAETFGDTGPLRVRMGLHTCEAEDRDGDYYGSEVNRAARLMSVAHGDQIVVSLATSALVRGGTVDLADLGEHRLRDLATVERVYQVCAPGLRREFPPLRSLDLLPGNLPRQVTTFVGRETQLASLAELLRRSSLVTLTGVGGVGKTRLALQVAAEVIAEFPDGAWFCELAPVTDPGAVWEALAAALRVQAHRGRSLEDSTLEYLAPKRLLLVLDNCEHLLDAVARAVDAIAQRCERVTVLATSREGLALAGEQMVAVPSLPIPPDGADLDTLRATDAVQLFSDRANAARNDFVLTDRDASAVGVLCRRLDGIPLAIELAAARVRSLSPDDLVARLDQRFKLLTRGSRAALERQQTLRGTIDWSYDLLEAPERRALERVSVFAGTCDLAAAEAVLAADDLDLLDVVDVLGQLVDKSLVVADINDDAGIRYRLLESIRQYAQERLEESGESATVRRRHVDYYVELAETAGPHLRSREQIPWVQRLVRDTDNFRAVLDWAVETPSPGHAFRMIAPFTVTGTAIGEAATEWADNAVAIPGGDDHPLFPDVAGFASLGATFAGQFERSEALVAAAARTQARLGSPAEPVLQARAVRFMFRDQLDEARRDAEAWVELAREAGDPYQLVIALIALGGAFMTPDPDRAIALFDEAVATGRDAGIASALSLGIPLLAAMLPIEESRRALSLLTEAVEVGTSIGDRLGVSMVLETRANISARRGEWPTTLRAAVDSAELKLQLGDLVNISGIFYLAAVAFSSLGHPEPAAVLIGKADALTDRRKYMGWVVEMVARTEAELVAADGEPASTALQTQGAALDIADAVAYLRAEAEPLLATPGQ